jgi:hypothetical protein
MKLIPKNTLPIKWTLSVLSLCLFSSCGDTKKTETPVPETVAPVAIADTVDFAVLPSDSTTHLISGFPKDLKATELTSTDLRLIDSLVGALVADYNSKPVFKKNTSADTSAGANPAMDLKEYKKQYLAVINARGEKEVWANYFCKAIEKRIEFVDWKKIPVKVIDGGNCFFNVKLNLARRKAYDFTVNSGG